MKKLFVIVVLTVSCVLSSNAQIVVFSCEGNVLIKQSGSEWVNAYQRQSLNLSDSVCVFESGDLRLLNQRTSQIFCSIKKGKTTVAHFIVNAQKQSSRILAELTKEMYQNATSDNNSTFSFAGASTRGEDYLFTDSLFPCLKNGPVSSLTLPEGFHVRTVSNGESFYYEFENQTDEYYYVNILIRNKVTGKEQCAFVADSYETGWPYVLITAHQKLVLDQYLFCLSNDFERILWLTQEPYDTNHLQELLSHGNYDDTINCKDIIIWSQIVL